MLLEATGNALAIARSLAPHVAEVVLAHAKQVRAISHARIKTDKVDGRVLADLLAADLIPAVWIGDERCRMLRRLVSPRRGLVKRRKQIKNEIAAALHRNLKGRNPASDPFGRKGREWIAAQQLPIDERLTVDGCLRQLDFLGAELAQIDEIIAQQALGDEDTRRLMAIPGIDVVCAATLVAVIGDIRRFPSSRHLVGYLGLHPTIRRSCPISHCSGSSSSTGTIGLRRVTAVRRDVPYVTVLDVQLRTSPGEHLLLRSGSTDYLHASSATKSRPPPPGSRPVVATSISRITVASIAERITLVADHLGGGWLRAELGGQHPGADPNL